MSLPVTWSHLCHLKTCIWMIVALIHTGSVNLTKWSMYIPCRGQFAQSRQRRIQRWLNNPRINVHHIYGSLIKASLANWSEENIFRALDTSLFWDEYCLVRLSIIHRGRALPLIWRVMEHESASVSFADYQEIIKQARSRLPESVTVILLADRGFVQTELMTMLTAQLGWHYRIRIKSNTWIMIRDVCALSRLWFILSVATLYVSAQGVQVVDSGKRRWVDTHWFRGNSYFRIGWDWVKAALLNGWKLINSVVFSKNKDPEPAMASRKQYEQRLYQLEFQVQTYSYNIS
jgi:hypothetical protein